MHHSMLCFHHHNPRHPCWPPSPGRHLHTWHQQIEILHSNRSTNSRLHWSDYCHHNSLHHQSNHLHNILNQKVHSCHQRHTGNPHPPRNTRHLRLNRNRHTNPSHMPHCLCRNFLRPRSLHKPLHPNKIHCRNRHQGYKPHRHRSPSYTQRSRKIPHKKHHWYTTRLSHHTLLDIGCFLPSNKHSNSHHHPPLPRHHTLLSPQCPHFRKRLPPLSQEHPHSDTPPYNKQE